MESDDKIEINYIVEDVLFCIGRGVGECDSVIHNVQCVTAERSNIKCLGRRILMEIINPDMIKITPFWGNDDCTPDPNGSGNWVWPECYGPPQRP